MHEFTQDLIRTVTGNSIQQLSDRFLNEAGPILNDDIALYFNSIQELGMPVETAHIESAKRLVSDTFEGWLLAQDYHVNELDHSPLETRDDYEG